MIDKPLFHDGQWSLLEVDGAGDTSNSDLIAYVWRKGKDLAVVVGNITDHEAQGLVQIGDLPKGETFDLVDQLVGPELQVDPRRSRPRPLRAPALRRRAPVSHQISVASSTVTADG